jgi:hypothetical protein
MIRLLRPLWSKIRNKPSTFPPSTHSHPQSDVTNLTADLASVNGLASAVGAALVTHTSDAAAHSVQFGLKADLVSGKVPISQIPDSLVGQVEYQTTWNPATNTPTLVNPTDSTTKGHYYICSADGTRFSIDFKIGDWCISNGTNWQKVDNTDAVTSVNGQTGAVEVTFGNIGGFFEDNQSLNDAIVFAYQEIESVNDVLVTKADASALATKLNASITKAQLDTAISDGNVVYVGDTISETATAATGTGGLVRATSPTLVTPNIDEIRFPVSGAVWNGVRLNTSGATLRVRNGDNSAFANVNAAGFWGTEAIINNYWIGSYQGLIQATGSGASSNTDICVYLGARIRNIGNTADAPLTCSSLTASGSVQLTEQTYTPTGTTQTINLNSGNLNTLSLGSTTGDVTLTLTVPTSAASGRIKIIQHGTTARGITIALSSLTAKWFSAIPTWSSQTTGKHTVLTYTRDGSFMNFSAVEEA